MARLSIREGRSRIDGRRVYVLYSGSTRIDAFPTREGAMRRKHAIEQMRERPARQAPKRRGGFFGSFLGRY